MPLKNLKAFVKGLRKDIDRENLEKFSRLKDLIVRRSKKVHKYKNRTRTLTNSIKGRFYKSRKNNERLSFYTVYYGGSVARRTNNYWIKNASDFYKRNTKKWK